MWHLVLQVGVAYDRSKETSNIVRDEQEISDKLSFVVIQSHVVFHIGLAIGQEKEVCVVCSLLATNPHDPNKNDIKVAQKAELDVQDPEDEVAELDDRWYVRSLKSH